MLWQSALDAVNETYLECFIVGIRDALFAFITGKSGSGYLVSALLCEILHPSAVSLSVFKHLTAEDTPRYSRRTQRTN
jgi:hypothetical protein